MGRKSEGLANPSCLLLDGRGWDLKKPAVSTGQDIQLGLGELVVGAGKALGPRQTRGGVCVFSGPLTSIYCYLSMGPIFLLLCAYPSVSIVPEWAPRVGLSRTVCITLGLSVQSLESPSSKLHGEIVGLGQLGSSVHAWPSGLWPGAGHTPTAHPVTVVRAASLKGGDQGRRTSSNFQMDSGHA